MGNRGTPSKFLQSPDDKLAEETFESKHYRDDSGRFVVPLIFKTNETSLLFPGSFAIALRRFLSLERRLAQNEPLRAEYVAFMQDYLESGHMQALPFYPHLWDIIFRTTVLLELIVQPLNSA